MFIYRKYLGNRPFKKAQQIHTKNSTAGTVPDESVEENPESVNNIMPLEIYEPTAFKYEPGTDKLINRNKIITEQDYLERYQNQVKKGSWAEQAVFKDEVNYLKKSGKEELANSVKIVSENPDHGFDILSYELDETEKQIEVKSINSDTLKSFFISQHEVKKSEELSNYYIYCVLATEDGEPEIIRLKNPKLADEQLFRKEIVTYKIYFQ